MIFKPGVVLVLWMSSVSGTDMCEMSASRISCASNLLNQCDESGVVADALRQFAPQARSQRCRKQLISFADALSNSSLWAMQMLDASAKHPEDGGYHLGHFDECIRVKTHNVRGKYCLADVGRSRMGICVPDGCTSGEVEMFMERFLPDVRVRENSCFVKGNTGDGTARIVLKYGVLGLVLWSVVITTLDLVSNNQDGYGEIGRKIIDTFSYCRSIRKLTSTGEGYSGIHFMRVATIFLLITHRRHQLLMDGPVKNRSYLQKVNMSPWPIFDTLIFLTGFLTVQRLQRVSLTKGKCVLLCAAKWLRIIPLYAMVIAFYALVFDGIGDGPLWAEWIGRESRRCCEYWWSNLSLVNNYISATGQCIAQSWYLAVTSHGFVVTLIFMHLKTGKAFVGLGSLAVSLIASLVLFLWNDYALYGPEGFGHLYIKTQYRLPSFLIGGASALLYHRVRHNNDKTTWVHFLTPFLLTILGLVLIACHRLDTESKMLSALVSSLTWSVLVGCIIIIFPLYNIGVSNDALLKSVFLPLSRLSYPALFSHGVVQLYLFGTTRTSEYVTIAHLIWMAAADIFASYVIAFVMYLVIDGPVISAIKIIFWNKEKETEEKK